MDWIQLVYKDDTTLKANYKYFYEVYFKETDVSKLYVRMKDIKIETKENKYYSSEDNIINDLIDGFA